VANQLKALGVTLTARAGAEGRLFGSITTSDVADAVKAAGGPSLDKRRIELNPARSRQLVRTGSPSGCTPSWFHRPRCRGRRQLARCAYEPGRSLRGPAGSPRFRGFAVGRLTSASPGRAWSILGGANAKRHHKPSGAGWDDHSHRR